MRKMNKKAVSIPVLIFFVLTIVLLFTSLVYFSLEQKSVDKAVSTTDDLDKVYIEESKLNFYLQDIFDKSVKDFKIEQGKTVFINYYLEELSKYNSDGWYDENLKQVKDQINEGNIVIDGKRLVLVLNIAINVDGKDVKGSYKYEKRFEKVFK